MSDIDLRHGRWQDVMIDVECDHCIFDAPFGERTHKGHDAGSRQRDQLLCTNSRELEYAFLTEDDVHEIVKSWAPRTRGWLNPITSHDLIPAWESAFEAAGRYWFAPIPILEFYRPRLLGDGPGSRAVFMVPSRPRSREFLDQKWGSLPSDYRGPLPTDMLPRGHYERSTGESRPERMGGKCLSVMQSIVRDYSRPGELIADMFGGHYTTALAAGIERRRAVSCEQKEDIHLAGLARVRAGYTPTMFPS